MGDVGHGGCRTWEMQGMGDVGQVHGDIGHGGCRAWEM